MNGLLPLPVAFLDAGPFEILVVLVAILLFFGPKRLPEIARSIGQTLSNLRRASRDFQDQIMHMDEPPRAPRPPRPMALPPLAEEGRRADTVGTVIHEEPESEHPLPEDEAPAAASESAVAREGAKPLPAEAEDHNAEGKDDADHGRAG